MSRDISSIVDNQIKNLSLGDKVIAKNVTAKNSNRNISDIVDTYISGNVTETVGNKEYPSPPSFTKTLEIAPVPIVPSSKAKVSLDVP